MKSDTIQFKIDPVIKAAYFEYCKSIGSTPSIHLRQYILKIIRDLKKKSALR